MPQDDQNKATSAVLRQPFGASELAKNAVSLLKERQAYTSSGARQFILDHLIRAVLSKSDFYPAEMLDELSGHRLSIDAIIDIYIPAAARILGQQWFDDDIDFATVTVASMRLQALLSIASVDSLDFIRPLENMISSTIVVPLGEQHTLGAFVLAAQLRRLGARVDVSFCETATDVVTRMLTDPPDIIMFTASTRATLETVAHLVLDISKVHPSAPIFALGGGFLEAEETAKEISGVDLVTRHAREALSFVASQKTTEPDQSRQ